MKIYESGAAIWETFRERIWIPRTIVGISSSLALIFFFILPLGVFFCIPSITGNIPQNSILSGVFSRRHEPAKPVEEQKLEFALNCGNANATKQCPSNYYPSNYKPDNQYQQQPESCPEYFRWIHEDLSPWRETGITPEMVEAAKAKDSAVFRLVILNGTAYLETYRRSYQTRDYFTEWGFLQLLRLYPGKIPDLDLIFNCGDKPSVPKENYPKPDGTQAPPPQFSYDGNEATSDIVFPDWSFWGWIEINIKPWNTLLKELRDGNKKVKWKKREPHAYWKGNPEVHHQRKELLKCNVSDKQDWNARIYAQNWYKETREGFKNSNLADQCKHRYKIYIEGVSWSVSEKYILACDSPSLLVTPRFYDFFSRGLMPLQHYWPIRSEDKCKAIKYAVDRGNRHPKEAQALGKRASKFIQEEVQMKYVYDYMLHLLTEYSKLLTYKPVVPPGAVELCSESMACPAEGLTKKFMLESMVTRPSDVPPCSMPPPYDPATLHSFLQRKKNAIKQVEEWEG